MNPCGPAGDSTGRGGPSPRERFDALLTDPRHYRGDLTLLRTAVRRGWIKDQADRDVACERFCASVYDDAPVRARERHYGPLTRCRVTIKSARTMIDMVNANKATEYAHWPSMMACQINGRRRERWRVGDMPDLCVTRCRLLILAAIDAGELHVSVTLPTEAGGTRQRAIGFRVIRTGRGGRRYLWHCPRCREARTKLYLGDLPPQDDFDLSCRVCRKMKYGH